MISTKRKGIRNEHRSKALLEAAGYIVTRASASLGVFDLIGIAASGFVLCQVKTRDWPVEMEQIREFRAPQNCLKIIHRWRDRESLPDVREVP
jgi:Holliday junction resolvase